MAAIASAPPRLSPSGTGGADPEDSNVSSPLSDVDDKDANDEDIEHMQLDESEAENSSVTGENNAAADNDGSDSESALSEANSDVNSEANDTEAETERLYDTPKSQRQRDVVVDQFNHGKIFEHTPSKLRRTTAPEGKDKDVDDAASVASSRYGVDESPTKSTRTKPTNVDKTTPRESQERKRKRSPIADNSESEQPLRKRTGSLVLPDGDADESTLVKEDVDMRGKSKDRSQSAAEDTKRSPRKRDTAVEDEVPERETRAAKKMTRNGAKRRGAEPNTLDEADLEIRVEAREETRDGATEDDVDQPDDEAEADIEDEAELAAKNIEEMERKQAAFKDWTNIEDMFCVFRDKLYKDRLQRLEEEEQSLLAEVPSHPEYLNMKQCLDDRLNRKLQEINTEYDFRIKAHQKRTVAQRGQIWGQFFQAVRETREHALEVLNHEWYEVQSARREAHSLPDYGLLFPRDPAQQIRNAVAYNTEVSTLAGLAKYQGFPAGPEMKGVSSAELEDDLSAMDRFRRGRQRPSINARDEFQPPAFNHLGPAGEQFLKDTPWANPNHSAHKLHVSNSGQQEAHSEHRGLSLSLGAAAAAAAAAESKSGLDSPTSTQRPSALATQLSESPELPRSLLNPATHQMKRVRSIPSIGRGSKAAAA